MEAAAFPWNIVASILAMLGSGGIAALLTYAIQSRRLPAEVNGLRATAESQRLESAMSLVKELREHIEWQRKEREELRKELESRIAALEARIAALEEENCTLRQRIAALEGRRRKASSPERP